MARDWREDRVGSAHRGENPLVMARMRSGFAVIGDTQHLPGYSLLLTDDPAIDHLTDLDWKPLDKIGGPVWRYPKHVRNDPKFAYSEEKHGALRAVIASELDALINRAY